MDESFVIIAPSDTKHPSLDASYVPGSGFPTHAHDWSRKATGGRVTVSGRHFVDAYGRVCHLRGVNLGGNCKTPANHDPSTFPTSNKTVTFVDRPFPLEEAHEHLSRLRRWGFTFIRFLVTWEAVEHAGPGQYDAAYLRYIRALLSLLPQYGLLATVSLHQDVWSRYSGGSGAPAWTLEAVGFDLEKLEETGAAWLDGVRGDGAHVAGAERGLWPCGYQKLAAATMFTCFWAGDIFAPKLLVNGTTPIQKFLQDAFLAMWETVARSLVGLDGVLGFEVFNEPHRGYIGAASLYEFVYETDLHLGPVPSPLASFLLGAGHPTPVSVWTRSFPYPTRHTSTRVLNPGGVSCWREDGPTRGQCIWEMHGVWGWDHRKAAGVVLRERYFLRHPATGGEVDWHVDCYLPLVRRWAERVRAAAGPDKLVFVEPVPNEMCSPLWTPERLPKGMVFSPHWYDLDALFRKKFGDFTVNVQGLATGMPLTRVFYWGQRGARDNYAKQIGNIVDAAYATLGENPVILGECGVPIDLNGGLAFQNNDWIWQARMMDALLVALERAMVGFTLWNYNPDNNDVAGDGWNGENFSFFSRSRATRGLGATAQNDAALDTGARVLRSVVRPYAAKTAGVPLRAAFDAGSGRFEFAWRAGSCARETEIFLPTLLTQGRRVVVAGLDEARGDRWIHDEARQTLFVVLATAAAEDKERICELEVTLDPPLEPMFAVRSFWDDFGSRIVAVGALAVACLFYWLLKLLG